MKRTLILINVLAFLALLSIGCRLQTPVSTPGVVVAAPPSASVYTVGEQVAVQSTSTDPNNIVRVALVVDGVIVREDSSPVATGQQQLSVIQTWVADKVGQHNLIVRATNAQGVSTDAGIYITVQDAPAQPTAASPNVIPTTTLPAATLALPPAPQPTTSPTNPAITVIVTATPQDTVIPSPTLALPTNTATRTLAPKTLVPEAATAVPAVSVPTVAVVATALLPTAAPPLPVAACSGQPSAFTFTASKTTITAGQSVTLNWGAVNNASIATLSGGAFNALGVGAPGTVTASPTTTTTYALTATCNNGGGTRTASVTINVQAAAVAPTATQTTAAVAGCGTRDPAISSFTASPSTVAAGDTVTIQWSTTNADSVLLGDIESFPDPVSPAGTRTVSLIKTTTFNLQAYCKATGKGTTAQVTVTFTGATCSGIPKIASFTANKNPANVGDIVTFSWGPVTNADKVVINDIALGIAFHKLVTATGSMQVTIPTEARGKQFGYTMEATCSVSNTGKSAQVIINVNP